jgi:Family of unknown function (DUF6441)
MPLTATLKAGDFTSRFDEFHRRAQARMESAALKATDAASRAMLGQIRDAMTGAGLGRLSNGLAATSDLKRGEGVHQRAGGGFSASGGVFIRSGSERTRGTIAAYTEGANIRPTRGRWLWIPTPDIPNISMRHRLTPAAWQANGLERRIGPLVLVRSVNGNPLLVAKNVGLDASGRRGSVKSLRKNGGARKGQIVKEFVVAFIGIPATARAARIDVRAIARNVANDLPALFASAMERA